jgi:transposase
MQHLARSETLLTITARALTPTSACPSCSQASTHVHSDYTRTPQDLPVSGQRVQLVLRVRRFRCPHPQCSRQTFAERLPDLPVWARHTSRLGTILDSIAVVLSGQAGSRLADQVAMPGSADTLLRRAKSLGPASRSWEDWGACPAPTPSTLYGKKHGSASPRLVVSLRLQASEAAGAANPFPHPQGAKRRGGR